MKLFGKKNYIFQKGFTLIELLIVIAVLGVLAAIVLVGINPAEQLKRGRDASRLQQVAQLGHAGLAYFTSQGSLLNSNSAFTNANWQTILVSSGDIKGAITAPAGGTGCAGGTSSQGSICYTNNGTTDFLIWTGGESQQYITKASGTSACPAGEAAYFIFDSIQGKSGVACVNTSSAPSAGIALK